MANRSRPLPCGILRQVGLNAGRSRSILASGRACYGQGLPAVAWLLGDTAPGNVPISLQDLLGCDFGVLFEEGGVIEDRLEVFGYLHASQYVKDNRSDANLPPTGCHCM